MSGGVKLQENDNPAVRTRLKALSKNSGLILLYHGVWSVSPSAISQNLHNVAPTIVAEQLATIGEFFSFVSVDEFAAAKSTAGLCAVSFDDGYVSVIEEGLPVFESLNVPFTIFINGSTLEGKVFWRDKIRHIIEQGSVAAFETFARGIDTSVGKRFYRYSKHPSNNSVHVESEVDRFLAHLVDNVDVTNYCFDSPSWLRKHPLITFGNHSHNHYVMSSLTINQQREEISRTQALLDDIEGINVSEIFSIPFGAEADFNGDTVQVVREMGYQAMLLSRGRINKDKIVVDGVRALERFMPREDVLLSLQTEN